MADIIYNMQLYIIQKIDEYLRLKYSYTAANRIVVGIDSREKEDLFSAPMFWAKSIRDASELSAELKNSIIWDNSLFDKVEAVGGYLNFYPNFKTISEQVISAIISTDKRYGAGDKKGLKVLIEHTSANPTGPIHIGRTRNSIIGDTLCRIMKFYGYEVKVQYFLNDLGRQISVLTYGIINDFGNGEYSPQDLVNTYIKYSERDKNEPDFRAVIDKRLLEMELNRNTLAANRHIVEKGIAQILDELKKININFDEVIWESDFLVNGKVYDVVHLLKDRGLLKNDGNASYIELDDNKIYLLRNNGTTLYILRDLAYNITKLSSYDEVITVLGEDHKAQYENILQILSMLDMKAALKPIFYSFVTVEGSKMSTRAGSSVTLGAVFEQALKRAEEEIRKRRQDLADKELLETARIIAVGAIRYNIVRVQSEKSISFNWHDALNFEGNSAPFIQYAYARASSILRKSQYKITASVDGVGEILTEPLEKAVIWQIAQFPSVVEKIASEKKVHLMASYLHQLADRFNRFYDSLPVLNSEPRVAVARLALVHSVKEVLGTGLDLLGIETPAFM